MSEAARIRRGSAAARPRTRAVATKPKAASRGRAGSLLSTLPISTQTTRRIVNWGAGLIVAALLVVLVTAFKLPQMAGTAIGEALGGAGFTVRNVVPLPATMSEDHKLAVHAVVADQDSKAMPLVDLEQIRAQLMQIGWVRDARVARRLPGTLVVDIVERTPAAIWQNRGKLVLIDADGVVLDDVALDRMPDLPLVIGPAANTQASALTRLLDGTPGMKAMMAGATWIGGRRWDVRFQSGEVLALPEGEAAASKALSKFARMDSTYGLLGKGYVRLDMRDAKKMYVRVSSEPGKRVQLGADKVI